MPVSKSAQVREQQLEHARVKSHTKQSTYTKVVQTRVTNFIEAYIYIYIYTYMYIHIYIYIYIQARHVFQRVLSRIAMSHGTHFNEWDHDSRRVMSRVSLNHVTYSKEARHTLQRVMSRIAMRFQRVMSRISTSHVTHLNKPRPTGGAPQHESISPPFPRKPGICGKRALFKKQPLVFFVSRPSYSW